MVMTFPGILFERPEDRQAVEKASAPDFFGDLNLDQIVDTITMGRDEYDLKPFFHVPLGDVAAVRYRHEIFKELEGEALCAQIRSFGEKMRGMRERLERADRLHYKLQKERWFLDAVAFYCEAVLALADDLAGHELTSRGLLAFRDYLAGYARSARFTSLREATRKLQEALASVRYTIRIKDDWLEVRRADDEADYSQEIEATFARFKQGAVKDYRSKYRDEPDMNHVEAKILDFVAYLHPDIFAALAAYCTERRDYLDQTVAAFDREIQFYLAYLAHVAFMKRSGLGFCYPELSLTSKEIAARDTFDLALANKLLRENVPVVRNELHLQGQERILVVSGPNQGGKTTLARTFGQLHYLASLGCPVPGRGAKLFLFDRLFSHFERQEDPHDQRGKLQDDLLRIHAILDAATPRSVIVLNEIFSSTSLEDAVFLARNVMDRIMELDLLCVCVTFIDELATLGPQTVSMVSTIVPDNPAERTYRIERRPADGLAYALSIAEKHRLTYDLLKERLAS